MKAELTAENRPAYPTQKLMVRPTVQESRLKKTDKNEGGVEVFVILLGVLLVKLCRFLAIGGEEVGAGIVSPQRFEELSEGGVEAAVWDQRCSPARNDSDDRVWRTRTHHFWSSLTTMGSFPWVST